MSEFCHVVKGFSSLLADFDLAANFLHVVITEIDVVLHAFQPVFVDHELVFHLVNLLFERTVLGSQLLIFSFKRENKLFQIRNFLSAFLFGLLSCVGNF